MVWLILLIMVLSLIFHFKILTQQPAIIVAVMKLKKKSTTLAGRMGSSGIL